MGELIGLLNLESDDLNSFSQEQMEFAKDISGPLAIAIANGRLLEQAKTRGEQLQSLSRRLVQVQEEERQHIARELHDEIGQNLTGLKLSLEMMNRSSDQGIKTKIGEMQSQVNELMEQVRALSFELRPEMLDPLGLLPTLIWYLERYTLQTGVNVDFEHTELGQRFDLEIETAAFRIIQQALTNVALHACVDSASVRIWNDQDTIRVQVEDSGVGFDLNDVQFSGRSMGLTGMRERALLLGGELVIESAPGAGTRLTAELPIGGGTNDEKG